MVEAPGVCMCDAQGFCFAWCVCEQKPRLPLSSAVWQVLVKIIIPASLLLTFKPESSRPTDTLINCLLHNFTK